MRCASSGNGSRVADASGAPVSGLTTPNFRKKFSTNSRSKTSPSTVRTGSRIRPPRAGQRNSSGGGSGAAGVAGSGTAGKGGAAGVGGAADAGVVA